MKQTPARSLLLRLGRRLGLIYQRNGQPSPQAPKRSRYDRGLQASPRLDEDIDELRARLEALEHRLG